jgi:hypothetical protein
VRVEKRENPIVNRLNKTKVEKFPDLAEEKEARLKELRFRDRDAQQQRVSGIAVSCFIGLGYETKADLVHLSYYGLLTR